MDTGRLHLGPQPGGRTFGYTRARRRSGQGTFVGWDGSIEGCIFSVVARLLAFLSGGGREGPAEGDGSGRGGGEGWRESLNTDNGGGCLFDGRNSLIIDAKCDLLLN